MRIRPTGIEILDKLIGGFPAGSLVCLSGDPRATPEIILYQFCETGETYYFATEREPKYIEDEMEKLGFNAGSVKFVDVYNVRNEEYEVISLVSSELRDAGSGVNIIMDTFAFFTKLRGYRSLFSILYEATKEKEALCMLYVPKGMCDESAEAELTSVCDVIFDVEAERAGDKIINKLSVPKIRGLPPLMQFVRYKITKEGIEIDTSRDIV
ncbi:RAD55 family ATPase [Candidatus Alkanophaga liquidiphilum]|nr:RecA-superfamily ATPase [Candidatus Alkanophaga liquidiphilum]